MSGKMRGKIFRAVLPGILPVLAIGAGRAMGDESADATITVDSLTGPTYNYTITLENTGDTDIGTFWYGWVDSPAYDFLNSLPTVTASPSGWTAPVSGGGNYIDGYSIEWYNLTGNPIAPGGSATFKFSSADSPDVLGGDEATYYNLFYSPVPMQTSFIYAGYPQQDPGYSFVLPEPVLGTSPVPEPASLLVFAVGLVALLPRRRRAVQSIGI